MATFALFLLLQAAAPAVDEEVVVTARGPKCSVAIANRIIGKRDFRARARQWAAGIPVRVVVGPDASYRCLAKIAFRLHDYGVTRVVFDSPSTAAGSSQR